MSKHLFAVLAFAAAALAGPASAQVYQTCQATVTSFESRPQAGRYAYSATFSATVPSGIVGQVKIEARNLPGVLELPLLVRTVTGSVSGQRVFLGLGTAPLSPDQVALNSAGGMGRPGVWAECFPGPA